MCTRTGFRWFLESYAKHRIKKVLKKLNYKFNKLVTVYCFMCIQTGRSKRSYRQTWTSRLISSVCDIASASSNGGQSGTELMQIHKKNFFFIWYQLKNIFVFGCQAVSWSVLRWMKLLLLNKITLLLKKNMSIAELLLRNNSKQQNFWLLNKFNFKTKTPKPSAHFYFW